jgi:hypothetical protein
VLVQRTEHEGWTRALGLSDRYTPMGEQSWLLSSFDRGDMDFFAGCRPTTGWRSSRTATSWPRHRRPPQPGRAHVRRAVARGRGPGGPIVIASDTAMWYSNIEEMWPSGYTNGNTYQMLLTYGEIAEFVGDDLGRVVPGHDMRIFERFPAAKVGSGEVAEVHVAAWDSSRIS